MLRISCLLVWLVSAVLWSPPLVCAAELPPAVERQVSFERDVRPLLERSCWGCHGGQTWESGLRLDRKEKALLGGDGGEVLLVGKSADSRLIHYVAGLVPEKIMPPDDERLTAEEIGILRAWIDQGLEWPRSATDGDEPHTRHWAFQPIRKPPVPAAISDTASAHPVDRFVDQQLQSRQIVASPRADRATLIRRLSLDLLGLAPTPEEVAAFVADEHPEAYTRLVDRLLSSAHFGERWGRHWLDLARYADSDGYEKDLPRPHAYRYRDWVIDALNRDLPFDQFTIQQLAGDLLPDPTLDQLLATGFHRQTLTNREGGADVKEDRDKQLVDRTNTTGAVWLGLTVGCAQCHSHKYDPISQREYFQLYAFFNAAQEAQIPAPSAEEAQRYQIAKAAHDAGRKPHLDRIHQYRRTLLSERLSAWEQQRQSEPIAWEPVTISAVVAESKAEVAVQPDGVWLVSGPTPDVDVYTLTWPLGTKRPTGFLLETVPQQAFPGQGAGRAPNGNFVLTEVRATWRKTGDSQAKPQPVQLAVAQADYVQNAGTPKAFAPHLVLDNDPKTGWAVGGSIDQSHVLLLEWNWPNNVSATDDLTLTLTLEQKYGGQHLLGAFRMHQTAAARPLSLPTYPEHVAQLLAIPQTERTPEQRAALLDFYQQIDPEFQELQQALQTYDRKAPAAPATQAMVFATIPKPEPTRVHLRGDFLSPGPVVSPRVPEVLNPLQAGGETPNRLDLARWLVSEDQPLTRRVAVNRIWQHLFGRAIVDPPDDFGLKGALPTHPELLDWLASEFSERGWSLKQMIRLIVTSETYQRSSAGRPDLIDVDPRNLQLARQNRFRLTGEILRDLSLQVSGLLDDRVGGPSIRPPLPSGVAALGYANSVKWNESTGGDRYRRGCYIFFQRTVPYPLLMTFDSPDSNVTCQRREVSNTPLQSLTLLNDPAFVECAQTLGWRLVAEGGSSTSDRLHALTSWTLGRPSSEDELSVLSKLFEKARRRFAEHPTEAAALLGSTAGRNRGESIDQAEVAAWISLARVMFNLDEFMTRP